VQVEQTGVVQTFSICNVRWDMQPLEEPELPAVIAIDGSHGGFLHTLGEVEPGEVTIGMEVEAVWKPVGERTGSILDIEYFRPRRRDPGGSRSERERASDSPPGEDDG
jgi:uncharacterized OB-fold protein